MLARLISEIREMLAARTRKARQKAQAWGLPLAVLTTFLLVEVAVGNMLAIAIGYLVLTIFILSYGLIEQSTPVRRAATYFLGFTVLCFGSGRVIYWFYDGVLNDSYEWMFDLGHLSLWLSTALTVIDLRERRSVFRTAQLPTERDDA